MSTGIVPNGVKSLASERVSSASAEPRRAAPAVRAKRCETCDAGAFDAGQAMGQCRASTPVVAIFPVAGADGSGLGGTVPFAAWPPVQRRQWCRRWRAVPAEQALADAEPAGAA